MNRVLMAVLALVAGYFAGTYQAQLLGWILEPRIYPVLLNPPKIRWFGTATIRATNIYTQSERADGENFQCSVAQFNDGEPHTLLFTFRTEQTASNGIQRIRVCEGGRCFYDRRFETPIASHEDRAYDGVPVWTPSGAAPRRYELRVQAASGVESQTFIEVRFAPPVNLNEEQAVVARRYTGSHNSFLVNLSYRNGMVLDVAAPEHFVHTTNLLPNVDRRYMNFEPSFALSRANYDAWVSGGRNVFFELKSPSNGGCTSVYRLNTHAVEAPPPPPPPPPPPISPPLPQMRICRSATIGAGYLIVDRQWDPTICGSPVSSKDLNVFVIASYTHLAVGWSMDICAGQTIPAGFGVTASHADPTRCTRTTTIQPNVLTITRLR